MDRNNYVLFKGVYKFSYCTSEVLGIFSRCKNYAMRHTSVDARPLRRYLHILSLLILLLEHA